MIVIKSFLLGLFVGAIGLVTAFKLAGAGGVWWYAEGGYHDRTGSKTDPA